MTDFHFQDEEFMSVAHKEQVLTDWNTFIRNGFQAEHFTRPLYDHLHLHCGFIAHYNQPTFWEYFFNADANRFLAFLNQFGGDRRSAETGMPGWWVNQVGSDLIEAMMQGMWLIHDELVEALINEADTRYAAQKWAEINERWRELTDSNPTNARALSSLGQAYEQTLPFEVYGNYMQLKPETRDELRQALEQNAAPQQDLFALYDWRKACTEPCSFGFAQYRRNSRSEEEQGAQQDQTAAIEDAGQSDAFSQQDAAPFDRLRAGRRQRLTGGQRRADPLARRRRLTTEAAARAKPQPAQKQELAREGTLCQP